MKSELSEAQGEKIVFEKEVHDQLLQLHAIQLQLHSKTGQNVDSSCIKAKLRTLLARNLGSRVDTCRAGLCPPETGSLPTSALEFLGVEEEAGSVMGSEDAR
ncbi:UNVERIFIED_CONTAM: hypothetical protein FKN15_028145 [Acipenser sinensis]